MIAIMKIYCLKKPIVILWYIRSEWRLCRQSPPGIYKRIPGTQTPNWKKQEENVKQSVPRVVDRWHARHQLCARSQRIPLCKLAHYTYVVTMDKEHYNEQGLLLNFF